MAAAVGARDAGAESVLIVDRERELGGVLLQCIHPGFGLHHFKQELTGPEYAQRFLEQVVERGIAHRVDGFVLDIDRERRVKLMTPGEGVRVVEAGAVVLAMGARERTRGAIRIPGTRPSGVLTAGLAQKFVNMMGVLPGQRVVILGSGDIGLIMARRLVLEGCEVAGVFEIQPFSSGLNRNIAQCLHDFDIPLRLSTTVAAIHGRDRLEGVTVAPVDERFQPDASRAEQIRCDTLLLSIGLIPENELSRKLNLRLDPVTSGPVVTSTMETSKDGVFACGNVVHIHDVVDFVTEEALLAGRHAGELALGRRPPADNVSLAPGRNVSYCVPHTISTDREHTVFFRVKQPMKRCRIRLGDVYERRARYVFPAEMVRLRIRPGLLHSFFGDTLRVEVVPEAEDDVRDVVPPCAGGPGGGDGGEDVVAEGRS